MNPPAERIRLFGVPIDNLTLAETVSRVEQLIQQGTVHQHVVVNVDKLVKFQKDPALQAAVLDCDLINADGQPVVWASRWLGRPLKERVAGIDLFYALIRRCAELGWRPYLLGARAKIVEQAATRLIAETPGLKVAGWRSGYWSDEEEAEVVAAIRSAHPEILFVAISSPKKELFLRRWKSELQVPFVMGVEERWISRRSDPPRAPVDAAGRSGVVVPADAGAKSDVASVFGGGPGVSRDALEGVANYRQEIVGFGGCAFGMIATMSGHCRRGCWEQHRRS